MNKADYLAAIAASAKYVGKPEEQPQRDSVAKDGALKCYSVFLLTSDKDGQVRGSNQLFYVLGEGTAEEEAFSVEAVKANATFGAAVEAFAATLVSAARPRITVDSVNEKYQFAIATAYHVDASDAVYTQRYFVVKDAQGKFQFKVFKG